MKRKTLAKRIREAQLSDRRWIAQYGERFPYLMPILHWHQDGFKKDPLTKLGDWKSELWLSNLWFNFLTLDSEYFREIANAIEAFKNYKRPIDPERAAVCDEHFWLVDNNMDVDQIGKRVSKSLGYPIEKQRLRNLIRELKVPHKKSNGGRPKTRTNKKQKPG